MPDKRARPDLLVASIAAKQHGVVSVKQLRAAGLDADAVLNRRRNGRLHHLHRGVYAVGHTAPSNERRWIAAVLAVGDGAVLSHRSAAELWGLLPPVTGPIDVSLPGRAGRRRRQGIRIHRPVSLLSTETTCERGIPVTSPARSLAERRFLWLCRRHRLRLSHRQVFDEPERVIAVLRKALNRVGAR